MPTIQVKIDLEDTDYCNGCRFYHAMGDRCVLYGLKLQGNWEQSTGVDYFAVTRPNVCKFENKEVEQ